MDIEELQLHVARLQVELTAYKGLAIALLTTLAEHDLELVHKVPVNLAVYANSSEFLALDAEEASGAYSIALDDLVDRINYILGGQDIGSGHSDSPQ